MCESALVLAKSDNLPGGDQYGGVLTSAVGLGDELISRLKTAGIEFKSWKFNLNNKEYCCEYF